MMMEKYVLLFIIVWTLGIGGFDILTTLKRKK